MCACTPACSGIRRHTSFLTGGALRRRFSDNAFALEEPKLKFYLAAPLVTTNGHRLGTLCVVGQKARRFSAEQANMLAGMAELVVRHSIYIACTERVRLSDSRMAPSQLSMLTKGALSAQS